MLEKEFLFEKSIHKNENFEINNNKFNKSIE